jgi:hypothetical protein
VPWCAGHPRSGQGGRRPAPACRAAASGGASPGSSAPPAGGTPAGCGAGRLPQPDF